MHRPVAAACDDRRSGGRLPPRPTARPGRTRPAAAARLGGLAVLVLVGALQWRRMVDGLGLGRVLLWAAVAVLAGAALVAAGRLRRHQDGRDGGRRLRRAARLPRRSSGIPLELLKPARWDQLADGLVRGTEALGTVWLPVRRHGPVAGADAAAPRRGAVRARRAAGLLAARDGGRGYPFIALAGLLALVATPVVSLGGTQPLAARRRAGRGDRLLPVARAAAAAAGARRRGAARRGRGGRGAARRGGRSRGGRGSTTGGSRRSSGPRTPSASTGRRATARSTGRGPAPRCCGSRPTSRRTGSCARWRSSTAWRGATAAPTRDSRTCRGPTRSSTSRTAGSGGRSGSRSSRCRCGASAAPRCSARARRCA